MASKTAPSTASWSSTLACVMTYPLVWHLSSAVPHDLGDPLMSTTLLWWNAHTTPLTDRWWDGLWFWPATGSVAFSDHRLGESLIATPMQWLGLSAVTAGNLTLLATFPRGTAVSKVERGALAPALAEAARPGDLVLCLGAGDITGVPTELLALLGAGGTS